MKIPFPYNLFLVSIDFIYLYIRHLSIVRLHF